MKKTIFALVLAAASSSAFAATSEVGESKTSSLHFSEEVVRVCGITTNDNVGSIVFGEGDVSSDETSVGFTVVDNGAHNHNGQTLISIGSVQLSDNIDGEDVRFGINTQDGYAGADDKFTVWTGQEQQVYAQLPDTNAASVNSGEATIQAVVTVHCNQ
ncbi:hypothetical protein NVP2275O_141 [Vibrio phage 2.275.O._10N.286.54.E11]|nr:hypothetical protein NVP2275O_141 [Vibrio phage 2.275.O._10N.286.54.E11]